MVKTLAKSLHQYKKGSVLTMLLSILEAAFEIFIPLYMADLIDKGIDMGAVWKYGAIILIVAALQLITGMLSAHVASRTSVGFSANLRQDMYDNVQTFAFSNIDKFSTASIVTRLTTDVTNIQNAYLMLIRMAIRGPVMLVFSMIVSFRINRTISLIFLAIIPAMSVVLYLIIRNVNPIFKRVFHTYDELNNVVQENVGGIRVVKSFDREDYEIGKFKGISQSIYEDFAKGERLLAFNSPVMQFFMYSCMILISWIGARAIVMGGSGDLAGMTTGDLTALFSYATQILMSLMMLSMVFAMITISIASARRIAELLEEKTDIASPDTPVTNIKDGSICFENVDFINQHRRCFQKSKSTACVNIFASTLPCGSAAGGVVGVGICIAAVVVIGTVFSTADGTVHGTFNAADHTVNYVVHHIANSVVVVSGLIVGILILVVILFVVSRSGDGH